MVMPNRRVRWATVETLGVSFDDFTKGASATTPRLRGVLSVPSPDPKLGQIFTRRWVAETLLDLSGYTVSQPLEAMTGGTRDRAGP